MVEGTHEKTTARVVVGEGASEKFEVKMWTLDKPKASLSAAI